MQSIASVQRLTDAVVTDHKPQIYSREICFLSLEILFVFIQCYFAKTYYQFVAIDPTILKIDSLISQSLRLRQCVQKRERENDTLPIGSFNCNDYLGNFSRFKLHLSTWGIKFQAHHPSGKQFKCTIQSYFIQLKSACFVYLQIRAKTVQMLTVNSLIIFLSLSLSLTLPLYLFVSNSKASIGNSINAKLMNELQFTLD